MVCINVDDNNLLKNYTMILVSVLFYFGKLINCLTYIKLVVLYLWYIHKHTSVFWLDMDCYRIYEYDYATVRFILMCNFIVCVSIFHLFIILQKMGLLYWYWQYRSIDILVKWVIFPVSKLKNSWVSRVFMYRALIVCSRYLNFVGMRAPLCELHG